VIPAKVIGTVWGARQCDSLAGRRLVEVRPLCLAGLRSGARVSDDADEALFKGDTLLAVDSLGADAGQLVLIAIGSRVRDIGLGPDVATKYSVVAIVDELRLEQ